MTPTINIEPILYWKDRAPVLDAEQEQVLQDYLEDILTRFRDATDPASKDFQATQYFNALCAVANTYHRANLFQRCKAFVQQAAKFGIELHLAADGEYQWRDM